MDSHEWTMTVAQLAVKGVAPDHAAQKAAEYADAMMKIIEKRRLTERGESVKN